MRSPDPAPAPASPADPAGGGGGRGADHLVAALQDLGVDTVFGLPGVHNLAVWEAAAAAGLRVVGVRHEQAAAYAADGYARATGRLGVAVVTTGPGAANTLGATGEAMASGAPVLVVATDVPSTLRRPGVVRGVLHETRDQAAMFAPVTKATVVAAAAGDLYADTVRAGSVALQPSSGPVYLGVPTDLLGAPAGSVARAPVRPAPAPPVDDDELARARELLARARRPLVWAGGGALRSGAGDLVGELARRLAAPVVTTFGGRGLLPPDHPCLVPGPPHVPAVGRLWDDADLVVSVGSDLDGTDTQNWAMPRPPALLAVTVDPADATKNYPADVTVAGDASAVLGHLLDGLPQRDGLPGLRETLDAVAGEVRAVVAADEPQAGALLDALDRVSDRTGVLLADMCIAGYWAAGFARVPGPRRLAFPLGWGTLGYAFPAAIGAALAGRGRALVLVGDGGFLFACGELATLVQEELPVTTVIVDDGGYGMLRFDQVHSGVPTQGVDLVTPDFVALARSFGVPARAVDGFGEEFASALEEGLGTRGPDVVVVRAALVPPPSTSPRWYRRRQAVP
ncbi:thiamine pyrophosphate-binding protein [Geodermatophilus sp. DSM 45219]|uniref:thiamine pyrophosphate-binding protein n=1 Tax=Geodermatophilus sp. DSM 45219 TaxID=1881103 RepID=UPI00088E0A71|nr:thiamine pyrophosphate-binding protein [Geodermatophilus sp. DSM 45219]SDO54348.1 acetolactate synthase-1/2/3 large subunit [Geodermatophilus sp. DSM 45219]